MSLVATRTDCTVIQHLWDVAVNCSIGSCKNSVTKGAVGPGNDTSGSLWSVVIAHEHRRQDDSHQISMTQNFRTATDEQVWQPWHRCTGVPVASVVDEHRRYVVAVPSASNQTSGSILNRLQPAHQSIRDAEEQRITVVQATGEERLD